MKDEGLSDNVGYVTPTEKQAKNGKYDIGLLGWWTSCNYGSVITYYGLRHLLLELGYSVLMVDTIDKGYNLTYNPRKSMARDFAIRQKYNKSLVYSDTNILLLNDICNNFIVGSDQMWGIWAQGRHDVSSRYYLDFAYNNKRKIVVGASFGNEYYVEKDRLINNKKYVKKLDAISVREDYGVKMAKYYYDVDATHILDPLFLCDRRAYYHLAQSSGLEKQQDYILCYILDTSEENKEYIRFISKHYNMPVKVILNAAPNKMAENLSNMSEFNVINATEEEWLAYINNSALVVTDSFHGTCMSIIFKKQFIGLVPCRRGQDRFYSLSRTLGLDDRMVYDIDELKKNIKLFSNPIDYERIYKIIDLKKQEGIKWVKDSLKIKKDNTLSEIDILKKKQYFLYRRISIFEDNIKKKEKNKLKVLCKKILLKMKIIRN